MVVFRNLAMRLNTLTLSDSEGLESRESFLVLRILYSNSVVLQAGLALVSVPVKTVSKSENFYLRKAPSGRLEDLKVG